MENWWNRSDWADAPEWHRLRRACLSRDRNRCTRCHVHHLYGRDLQAHHIIPRREGGSSHLGNLITLCKGCHDLIEQEGLRSVAAIIGYSSCDAFDPPAWTGAVYGSEHQQEPEQMTNPELVAWVKHLIQEHSKLYHYLWSCPYANPGLGMESPEFVLRGSVVPPCKRRDMIEKEKTQA